MFNLLLLMLLISSPFVVAIVISRYYRHKDNINQEIKMLQIQLQESAAPELIEEIKRLKKRIHALEALNTEQDYPAKQKVASIK